MYESFDNQQFVADHNRESAEMDKPKGERTSKYCRDCHMRAARFGRLCGACAREEYGA